VEKITSPPEIVAAARERAESAGRAAVSDPLSGDAASALSLAVRELSAMFPHLDDATLVLIADHIGNLAWGLFQREPENDTLGTMAVAYGHITAMIGESLTDDQAA
jgi:hypothetical protein